MQNEYGLKNLKFLIYFLLVSLLLVFWFYNTLPIGWRFNNDDLRNTLAAEVVAKYHEYVFYEPLNQSLNTFGFVLPWYQINSERLIYPNGFLWPSLLLGPLYTILNFEAFSNIYQLLTYILILLFSFLILRQRIDIKRSLIGVTIISLSPLILSNLDVFYPDLTTLLFLTAGYLFSIKWYSTAYKKHLYIWGFLLFFAILQKLVVIISLIPFYIFLLVKKRINIKDIIFMLVLFLITILPQFWFNYITLGNPFESSYTSSYNVYDGKITNSAENDQSAYKSTKNVFLYRFINEYLLPQKTENWYSLLRSGKVIFPLLFIVSPLMIFLFVGEKRKYSYLYILTIIIFLVSFLFFGNMRWGFWFWDINIRASFVRYLYFPLYLLLIDAIILFLYKKSLFERLIIYSVVLLIQFGTLIHMYPFSMYTFWNFKQSFQDAYIYLQNNIEDGSIILSPWFDDGFLTHSDTHYKVFDYWYIPKAFQWAEITKVVSYAILNKIPVYVYFMNSPSATWWNNHLVDFESGYNLEEIYTFNNRYFIYRIDWLK